MRKPVFRLAAARLISDAGGFAAIFIGIGGKATFRLHATPGQMALEAAATGIAAIAGGLAAGVLIDRTDPRRVLIGAEMLVVPSVLALMVPESIWPFIAVVPLASFAGGFVMTSVASFAPFIAGTDLANTNIAL